MKLRADGTAEELAAIKARLRDDIIRIKGKDPPKNGIYRRYFDLNFTPVNDENPCSDNKNACNTPGNLL